MTPTLRRSAVAFGSVLMLSLAMDAHGQADASPRADEWSGTTLIDAPAPPLAPATISRDAAGRATVRAVRVTAPLEIDGVLDEEVYQTHAPAGGFVQQFPKPGATATESVDLWVLFDDENVYVSALLHETHPERRIATERRRDALGLSNDDNFMVDFDTFYDRHNSICFNVTSAGGMRDQVVSDSAANWSWNTVWQVKVASTEQGWSMEMAIPFKSLRYKRSGPQVWGFNARRTTKWKNEFSYLNPVPAAYGANAIHFLSTAATLVGIEAPTKTINLEAKAYGITSLTTDRSAPEPLLRDGTANAGIDFKYGLTRGLTSDFTINTDFAQVEEDVQQVNLTRFGLFFPEKRDFFLEGQGNFGFGGQGEGGSTGVSDDVPTIFFSRQIGLSSGRAVPIRAGGRLTGRFAGFEIGVLNIESGESEEAGAVRTNFSAARVRRNILRRSNVGVITTVRRPSGGAQNVAYGADANLRFHDFFETNLYVANARTEGRLADDDLSYRARAAYLPDRWGVSLAHLKVGRTFNPEIGFVRRKDIRLNTATARYSPRPRNSRRVRQYTWQGSLNYITNAAATRTQNRDLQGDFRTEFHSSDVLTVSFLTQYEFVPAGFTIAPRVVVPLGEYDWRTIQGSYALGNQRLVSGTVNAQRGSFYGGTRTAGGFSGRLSFSPRFVVEPGVALNRVELPFGAFSANLITTRFVVTPTARMSIISLVQYNASARTMTSSARLNWEYTPGSQLFVVYSDGRDMRVALGQPTLRNQTVAVKATRLVRF